MPRNNKKKNKRPAKKQIKPDQAAEIGASPSSPSSPSSLATGLSLHPVPQFSIPCPPHVLDIIAFHLQRVNAGAALASMLLMSKASYPVIAPHRYKDVYLASWSVKSLMYGLYDELSEELPKDDDDGCTVGERVRMLEIWEMKGEARFDCLDEVFAIKRKGRPLEKPLKPSAEQVGVYPAFNGVDADSDSGADACTFPPEIWYNHITLISSHTDERYPSWHVPNASLSSTSPIPLQTAKALFGYG